MTAALALAGIFLMLVAGGVGFIVPEDVTLVGAGVLAHQRAVALGPVCVVATLGLAGADWILYLLGRRFGPELVAHPRLARLVGQERLETVRNTLLRYGARAVFLARFVLGSRMVTFFAAGAFGVPLLHFGVAEGAAAAIFATAMITLGYLFANQAERLLADVHRLEHWLILGGLVALGIAAATNARAIRTLLFRDAAPLRDAAGSPSGPPPRRDRPT